MTRTRINLWSTEAFMVGMDRGEVFTDGSFSFARPMEPGSLAFHFKLRTPDLQSLIGEFVIAKRTWNATISLAVYFPAWCGLLACSIAPTVWLRRRRNIKSNPAGFPVISH